MPPAISVVVPARDAAATLPRTLSALAAQQLDDAFEVVVVDDGSCDATAELARAAALGPVVESGGVGPAGARHVGVAHASAPLLAFTDADCFPAPDWLAAGVSALRAAELVQGAVAPDPETPVGPFDRTLWVSAENGLYESANLFVTRELFERVGGFESWLRPRRGKELGEDVWLGWRARRARARTAFCERALVHHAVLARGPAGAIADRARLRFFPQLARRVEELRGEVFFGRVFLSRRSAAFDLAVAAALAAATIRRWEPVVATAPYAWQLVRDAGRWGPRRAPQIAAVALAADAVGAAALLAGSVRARSPLL
jgi:glycosyltransferase involved in cell wall biosynthesis